MRVSVDMTEMVGRELLDEWIRRMDRRGLRQVIEPRLKSGANRMLAEIRPGVPVKSGAMKAAIRAEMIWRRGPVRSYGVQLPRRKVLQKAAEKLLARRERQQYDDIARQMEGKKPSKRKKTKAPSKLALTANRPGQEWYYPAIIEYGSEKRNIAPREFMRGPAVRAGRGILEDVAREIAADLMASARGGK